MSAASSIEALYNVEPEIEDGWKRLLAAQDPALPTGYAQRETANLTTDRIDIQCQLGAHTGHRHRHDGEAWLDAWSAQITLQINTERLVVDPTGVDSAAAVPSSPEDRHNSIRTRLRILAQYASGSLTEALMPYHVITMIKEAGSTPTLAVDDDIDVSEITFDCLISIRSNAWPVAETPPTEVPVNLTLPYITGPNNPPQQGDTLTAHPGVYSNGPYTTAHEWVNAPGPVQTGPTILITEDAEWLGVSLHLSEVATNAIGPSDPPSESASYPPVEDAP